MSAESRRTRKKIVAYLVRSLSRDLVERLLDKKTEVVVARRLVNFFIDTDRVEVVRRSDGHVSFRCEVILRKGEGVDNLFEYQIDTGAVVVQGDFAEGELDTRRSDGQELYYSYRIEEEFEMESSARLLHVKVVDGSRAKNVRSYTFYVPRRAAISGAEGTQ